ncbi:GNAT family N-acetyltransferase [Deinococcus pimensis]|uniref:GNAT family N-acetyltransferase n=1 Tax=Deinococcus pimensis TaxID=309888 RepID=UPI0004838D4F|nr:GNAT family N-acetyltransferase [Deinococcus pimensis]
MDLRVLTERDAAAYFALRLSGLRESPRAFGTSASEFEARGVSSVEERLRPGAGTVTFGAFVDGELVGIATLARETGLNTRHKAFVVGMYVAPHVRGRGVARAVLTRLITHARAVEGLEQLMLAVSSTQTAARALYASLGFVTFGLEPRALKVAGEYVDEEHMLLVLEPAPA